MLPTHDSKSSPHHSHMSGADRGFGETPAVGSSTLQTGPGPGPLCVMDCLITHRGPALMKRVSVTMFVIEGACNKNSLRGCVLSAFIPSFFFLSPFLSFLVLLSFVRAVG